MQGSDSPAALPDTSHSFTGIYHKSCKHTEMRTHRTQGLGPFKSTKVTVKNHILRLLTAVLLIASGSLYAAGAAAAAPADIGDLTCNVTSKVTYDPPLTNTPKETHITFDATYKDCYSLTGSTVTSGSRSGHFTDDSRSCLDVPLGGEQQEFTVQWDGERSSTVQGTAQGGDVLGATEHTLTGPVTDGEFDGGTFAEVVVQAPTNLLDCLPLLGKGVATQTGAGQLTII